MDQNYLTYHGHGVEMFRIIEGNELNMQRRWRIQVTFPFVTILEGIVSNRTSRDIFFVILSLRSLCGSRKC